MGKRIFIDYTGHMKEARPAYHTGVPGWSSYDYDYVSIRDFVLSKIKQTAATHVLIESKYYFDFISMASEASDIIEIGKDGEWPFMYWMGIRIEGIPEEEANKFRVLK